MLEPIKKYDNLNYHVTLYPNRIEITEGNLLGKKSQIIPIRNIASFDIPFARPAEVKTNDGKKVMLKLTPVDAKDLQARVMELM